MKNFKKVRRPSQGKGRAPEKVPTKPTPPPSFVPPTPGNVDDALQARVVLTVLGLVTSTTPTGFAIALGKVIEAGSALYSHRR